MLVSYKQRFMLYLLTLMLVWVNTVAAPYQCISTHTTEATADMVLVLGESISATQQHPTSLTAYHHPLLQAPVAQNERGIHSAYPAEESVEETEFSHRKDGQGVFLDEQGMLYALLPSYLAPASLVEIIYPAYHPRNNQGHVAMRNQPTYLLDCVFLI